MKKQEVGVLGKMSIKKMKIYFNQGNNKDLRNNALFHTYGRENRKDTWEEFNFLSKKIEFIIAKEIYNQEHECSKICLLCSIKQIFYKFINKTFCIRNIHFGEPVMSMRWWPYDWKKPVEIANTKQNPINWLSKWVLIQIKRNNEIPYFQEIMQKLIIY